MMGNGAANGYPPMNDPFCKNFCAINLQNNK